MDAFTDFWRAFNGLYGTDQTRVTELARIGQFIQAHLSPETAGRLLALHPAQVDRLLSRPVVDMRGNGRDTKSSIAGFLLSNDPVTKIQHLLAVIYQIRCNLEHGQKSLADERDICLCSNAAPIVAEIVKACL